jgi:hypothetical protein
MFYAGLEQSFEKDDLNKKPLFTRLITVLTTTARILQTFKHFKAFKIVPKSLATALVF